MKTQVFIYAFPLDLVKQGGSIEHEATRRMAAWDGLRPKDGQRIDLGPKKRLFDLDDALPGKGRAVEFNNFQTSGVSICVHTIIFFGLITILLIAVGISINIG
ncbi:hypothetical protein HanIR_Chr14g0710941 [Helianthus annuus]|nr:hypothetical protein HanIR_Chr14g0710941 [Helianthus annuus]